MYNGVNTTFECVHKGPTSIQCPFNRHEMDISTIDKFPYGKEHPIELGRLHHGGALDFAFCLMNLLLKRQLFFHLSSDRIESHFIH